MTPIDAASRLNGNEYREEGSRELFAEMKKAGLVAVYGASDDIMVFNGAIDDEVGCYNGGTAFLTSDGLLVNECEDSDCPYFLKLKQKAATIVAIWAEDPFSWTYKTSIPHETFIIKEDGEDFCRGIVFALADVVSK